MSFDTYAKDDSAAYGLVRGEIYHVYWVMLHPIEEPFFLVGIDGEYVEIPVEEFTYVMPR